MTGRCLASLFLLAGASALSAQVTHTTASRLLDVQAGATFVSAKPDYVTDRFRGFGVYGDVDFKHRFGVEGEIHRIYTPTSNQISETTYEIGGRYFHTFGALVPYAKVLVGRGVFNYPNGVANLAYNMFALGGGADVKLGEHLRLRGDYEFQKWSSFPNGGLDPQLVSVGVAYHFTAKPRYR